MQNRDWLETGEDILKSVVNAVEKQDYAGLSKKVEDKINTTVEHINETLNGVNKVHYGMNNMRSSTYKAEPIKSQPVVNRSSQIPQPKQMKPQIVPNKQQIPQLYAKKPPGTYSGTACKVLGTIGAAMTGTATFILTVVGIMTGSIGVWLANMIVGGGLLGSIGLLRKGIKLDAMVGRFKQYVARIGHTQYIEIEQLAKLIGKKTSFVQKDVRKMIEKGFFLQGHLDDNATTLITSDFMYRKYLDAENGRRVRELETTQTQVPLLEKKEEKKEEKEVQGSSDKYPVEVQKVLDEGNEYIQHIRACNDRIPGEEMSRKLAQLEDIIIRIFEQLKKNPDNVSDLHKMMKYYLPTTRKLIDAYCELDGQPSYGENNILNTKKEIEDTLDVINDAFGKLFDDMFEDAAWDISTEISTMKTMLAKEGLTGERDFQLPKEDAETE